MMLETVFSLFFFLYIMSLLFKYGYLKVDGGSPLNSGSNCMNPWSISTLNNLLQKMNAQISKYTVRNFGHSLLDVITYKHWISFH